MNGADVLLEVSESLGVEVCFANPGTTEMALVDALSRRSGVRPILTLFEGVASGAADGYARIAGKPASVLLHLGPGLANASANLHNARRGQSPVVNWVGDHASWLVRHDPPLASDIEAIARGTSKWIRTARSLADLPVDAAEAVHAATAPVPGVATLILPADFAEAPWDAALPCPVVAPRAPAAVPEASIEAALRALRGAKNPLVLVGGVATDRTGLTDAARLAEALSATLLFDQFPRCARRAPDLPSPDKLGYLPFQARAQLQSHDVIALFGADEPVPFFGYAGDSPKLVPDGARVLVPAPPGTDVHAVLAALCDAAGAARAPRGVAGRAEKGAASGALQPDTVCASLARLLPEDAVVVDEGITSSLALYPALTGAAPHDYIASKGGSIGFATPVATGAAIAARGRRVVAYVGDGSAAYTLQSLWTQAREGLPVTTVVLVNDKYAILQMELMRAGGSLEGAGGALTELDRPPLDFEHLAGGFGVPARTVKDLAAFDRALEESFATPGPMLIACRFG